MNNNRIEIITLNERNHKTSKEPSLRAIEMEFSDFKSQLTEMQDLQKKLSQDLTKLNKNLKKMKSSGGNASKSSETKPPSCFHCLNIFTKIFPKGKKKKKINFDLNDENNFIEFDEMEFGKKRIYKIVIIGDERVGKTKLIETLVKSNPHQPTSSKKEDNYVPTIGCEFHRKKFILNQKERKKVVKTHVWDTSGSERFQEISEMYYKASDCGIIMFDLTSKKSLKNVEKWFWRFRKGEEECHHVFVVGNKNDVYSDNRVWEGDIKQVLKKLKVDKKVQVEFMKISAKNEENVEKLFSKIVQKLILLVDKVEVIGNVNSEIIE